MTVKRVLVEVGAVFILAIAFLPESNTIAIRPFRNSKLNASGCSTETALSGLNCPCKLNGQKCLASGSRCINRICQCGPAFLNDSRSGVLRCAPTFYAFPTIGLNVVDPTVGVAIPCNLAPNYPIPGLNLTFLNAVRGVNCDNVVVSKVYTDDTAFNLADTSGVIPSPYTKVIQINPFTGEIIPNLGDVGLTTISLYMDPGSGSSGFATYFTQVYTGFCVDQRGVSSNTFSFAITFLPCPPP